jgi:hypothetical protein
MNLPSPDRVANLTLAFGILLMGLWFGVLLEKAAFEAEGVCEYVRASDGAVAFCNGRSRPEGDGWTFQGFAKSNPTYRVYARLSGAPTPQSRPSEPRGWRPPTEREA